MAQKRAFFCLIFWLSLLTKVIGQDTVFVDIHRLPGLVRNVFNVGVDVIANTGDHLYKWKGSKWEELSIKFNKPYVFYDDNYFESDFIPPKYIFDTKSIESLIPEKSVNLATYGKATNRFFIATAGKLFEYEIFPYYTKILPECSIRDIYIEDGLKVISTYSGIYINDSIRLTYPASSNGPLVKLGDNYVLCNDVVFTYHPPAEFIPVSLNENPELGHVRKIVMLEDEIYFQFTLSIAKYDSIRGFSIVHSGHEYIDIEVINNSLFFSTFEGKVFRYTRDATIQLYDLGAPINDIYTWNQWVYYSSDKGLYRSNKDSNQAPVIIHDHDDVVAVAMDVQANLWISTEFGLYIKPRNFEIIVPVIPSVEFNREAIFFANDTLYAGSVSGLYKVSIYSVMQEYLPAYLQQIKTHQNKSKLSTILLTVLPIAATALLAFVLIRNRKYNSGAQSSSLSKEITLEQFKHDILQNKILSVKEMADHYDTNPVQLNRVFMKWGTSPGRFLRKVRIEIAGEMIRDKAPLEAIVKRTGFSAIYIRRIVRK
ncbi:MAG TPA: hypothetical protein VIS49_14700 [Cyclobacteriaceae bacterium]